MADNLVDLIEKNNGQNNIIYMCNSKWLNSTYRAINISSDNSFIIHISKIFAGPCQSKPLGIILILPPSLYGAPADVHYILACQTVVVTQKDAYVCDC